MRFWSITRFLHWIAMGLAREGHDAVHVRDIGMAAATDSKILDLAASEDRILISADTDFGAFACISERC